MKKFSGIRLFIAGLILILGVSFFPAEYVKAAENPVTIKKGHDYF